MHCAIWYHLYNLKNAENTYEGVLLLVKLQVLACNFTKRNTPSWVFFTFHVKIYKWYQIVQSVSYKEETLVRCKIIALCICILNQWTVSYLSLALIWNLKVKVSPVSFGDFKKK